MNVGVSGACFFPQDTALSMKTCADLGFKYTEVFMGTHSEMQGSYLKELKNITQDNGLNVTSIHPFTSGYEYILFFSGYERRIYDSIDYYKNYFNAACELGAKYVVFHGDNKRARFIGVQRYAEIFALIDKAAKEFGVRLVQENVSTSHIGSPENLAALKQLYPDVRFTLDIKQACRGGYDPLQTASAMGQNIVHVHLNDWAGDKCRLPCRGNCDLKKIVNTLDGFGYNGAYMIEVYRDNFENPQDILQSKEDFLALFNKQGGN